MVVAHQIDCGMGKTEKQCLKCGVVKPFDNFSPDKRRADWRQGQCKVCRTAQMQEHRAKDPEKSREIARRSFAKNRKKGTEYRLEWKRRNGDKVRGYALKSRYDITQEQVDQMKSEQGGLCPLCARELPAIRAHTDHSHATGKIRGILCGGCNIGLGFIEKPDFLPRALAYLKRHQDGFQTEPRSGL